MGERKDISPHSIRNILFRDYILSFLAFFVFLVAFSSLTPTLPLYLARLGSNEREIGILVGAIGVASLVSRLLVGRVLRKHSERLVMMGGSTLFALSFLALIVFRPFWPFLVVRLFQGIAFASLDTAAIAYAIKIVPEAYRARGITYFLLATSLSSAVAATSSVFIVNEYGFTVLLLACAGLSSSALLLSWKLKEATATPVETSTVKNILFFEPKILAPAVVSFLPPYLALEATVNTLEDLTLKHEASLAQTATDLQNVQAAAVGVATKLASGSTSVNGASANIAAVATDIANATLAPSKAKGGKTVQPEQVGGGSKLDAAVAQLDLAINNAGDQVDYTYGYLTALDTRAGQNMLPGGNASGTTLQSGAVVYSISGANNNQKLIHFATIIGITALSLGATFGLGLYRIRRGEPSSLAPPKSPPKKQ